MQKFMIAAASALIAFGGAASAKNISEEIAMCADAVNDAGLAKVAEYDVKFASVAGASVKRLAIELVPTANGETIVAECRIKRGKVIDVALKD